MDLLLRGTGCGLEVVAQYEHTFDSLRWFRHLGHLVGMAGGVVSGTSSSGIVPTSS